MKPLRQFAIGMAILGLVVWGLAKLMPAPMTPEQMREQASASALKLPSPAEQQRQLEDEVKKSVKLKYNWTTSGFGTVMIADITISNPTSHAIKDTESRCNTYGASGTKIGGLKQMVYELVKPKSTKTVKQVNMGFIHSQTDTIGCIISNLVVLSGPAAGGK